MKYLILTLAFSVGALALIAQTATNLVSVASPVSRGYYDGNMWTASPTPGYPNLFTLSPYPASTNQWAHVYVLPAGVPNVTLLYYTNSSGAIYALNHSGGQCYISYPAGHSYATLAAGLASLDAIQQAVFPAYPLVTNTAPADFFSITTNAPATNPP
jgi:hypothetical protein